MACQAWMPTSKMASPLDQCLLILLRIINPTSDNLMTSPFFMWSSFYLNSCISKVTNNGCAQLRKVHYDYDDDGDDAHNDGDAAAADDDDDNYASDND